jgi:hypothetical protein
MAEAKFGWQSWGTARQQISSKMTSVKRGRRRVAWSQLPRFKSSNDASDTVCVLQDDK